ncbi:MAG: hypothetical protein FWE16_02630 [Firmicutes bacterium]|nr:hypothetical protein [Bacillota bacterium]
MEFTNETLKRDIRKKSIAQSYLLFSTDILHLDEIAKWFAKHFKVTDTFWLTPKDGTNSITVDQTINFTDKVNLASIGERKLFIITDTSQMTPQAQNKMLKIIEEPRTDTTFLLLASNEEKVLNTIKSRCVIINVPVLENSLTKQRIIDENKNSPQIFDNAKKLLTQCKTLDDSLSFLGLLTQKENLPITLIALAKAAEELPLDKKYAILKNLAIINRNVGANCNATNAFDLLLIDLFNMETK